MINFIRGFLFFVEISLRNRWLQDLQIRQVLKNIQKNAGFYRGKVISY